MKFLRFLGIILALTIEVRVKAAISQDPDNCIINKNTKCAVFANKPTVIKSKTLNLQLRSGTILFRNQKNEWNFVDGTIQIQTANKTEIKTRVGTLSLNPGQHWVQWRDEKIWIYAMEGIASLRLLSSESDTQIIPEGFVNWFGYIGSEDKNLKGVPKMISLNTLDKSIGGLSSSVSNKILKKESRSLSMSSDFYRDIVQLMENQKRANELALEKREAQKMKRQNDIRELFRSKYLSPVDFEEID